MDRPQDVDPRLARLEQELAAVVRRLEALEAAVVTTESSPEAEVMAVRAASADRAVPAETDLAGWATLIGRSFIVLGGAYLLRALTEGGRLPLAAGAGIGLLYAGAWLWAAWRDAHRARRPSAHVHGATAVLVGWPLVWEATARFGLFTPATAALVLLVLTVAAYVVAHRFTMPILAGAAGFGTVGASLAVALSADAHGATSLLLVTLGAVTYWVSDAPGRGWLRWPMAIAAGLSVMAVTFRVLATPPRETVWLALVAQAWLLATMQGSLAVRFVLLQRPARLFDVLQAASGLAIGIGGAALVVRAAGTGLTLVGGITAIFASGAYLAAYLRLVDRPRLASSYYTAMTFGIVALVLALFLLFEGTVLAAIALCLAVGMFVAPAHVRLTLVPHGAWLVMVALAASGAVRLAWTAWVGTPGEWPALPLAAVVVMGVGLVLVVASPAAAGEGVPADVAKAARIVAAGLAVAAAGGLVVLLVAPALAGRPPDAGVLASVRTGVVALLALGLGAAARWPRLAILRALVYPVLVAGGIRLFVDDFRHSEPATLFMALAVYGAALAFAPRMASRL